MRRLAPLLLLMLLCACRHETPCTVSIGPSDFSIDPNTDANYAALFHPGGYVYLTGGHRGIVVIRTALHEFVAYERTCPCDNDSRVVMSTEWSGLLECPTCHTLFDAYNFGTPMEGAATPCPLYPYSTLYQGGVLHIY